MKKAILFVSGEKSIENYQLLIGLKYSSINVDKQNSEYNSSLEQLSKDFAKELCKNKYGLELRIVNGFKINDLGGFIQAPKINYTEFQEKLISQIKKLKEQQEIFCPFMNLN